MERILDTKQWYISQANLLREKNNGSQNNFYKKYRDESLKKFLDLNFPTKKNEEWKYTDVSPIIREKFIPSALIENPVIEKEELKKHLFHGFDYYLLTFLNGLFSKELSDVENLPEGILIGTLKDSSIQNFISELQEQYFNIENSFNALNNIFAIDGFVLIAEENVKLEKPIQILFLNGNPDSQVLSSPHNFIIAKKNSQLNLIINFKGFGDKKYFTNSATEIFMDESSIINYYKIQDEKEDSFHIEKIQAIQKDKSIFNQFNLNFGGNIVRNDINTKLDGEFIETHYYGLYLAQQEQHIDNHTFVDHAKPHCTSNELYKGILDDKSHGVFNGKIIVRPGAQKTNAYQQNKTVLLSKNATIDTKPQLEIFADDVKCTHGATVGHLDDEAEFYIRSRGVPEELAKSILIRAFASDVVEIIKIEELREQINHMIFEHLHRIEFQNQ